MGDLDETINSAVEHARESRLNSIVAVLVALAATLMALDNIKDGNVTQAMSQAARYEKEKGEIKAQAEGYQREYDRLNLHDDQFDLSDAGFSVAIALLGVTALTRKRWLLGLAGLFLLIGVVFGLAGFFNWSLHPDGVMAWLS